MQVFESSKERKSVDAEFRPNDMTQLSEVSCKRRATIAFVRAARAPIRN